LVAHATQWDICRRKVPWKFRKPSLAKGIPVLGVAMTKELQELLEAAKKVHLSPDQKEKQRRSFAFGNTNIENPRITRETVDKEAEALKGK
jgi:hypothetical protein